jgi:hypothetical protein
MSNDTPHPEAPMLNDSRTVTTALTLSVSAVTGDADLDPLAVTLAIGVECGEPVLWVFARDLLAAGVREPAGEGDIAIEPADSPEGHQVRITLTTDCLATMLAPRDKIVEFLVETFTLVASGCEFDEIDFDAEINALLG